MSAFDFLETHGDRFTVLETLGTGGFGVVYRVLDRDRGLEVALKVLKKSRPVDLALFKREFRTLAGVSHPNLVQIYDLLTGGDRVFFTMEYVAGVPFDLYVGEPSLATLPTLGRSEMLDALGETAGVEGDPSRTRAPPMATFEGARSAVLAPLTLAAVPSALDQPSPVSPDLSSLPALTSDGGPDVRGSGPGSRPSGRSSGSDRGSGRYPVCRDHARLRQALAQLARGVGALHARGVLHRDLKPANVIVTATGRVAILDFGLVQALVPAAGPGEWVVDRAPLMGTPNYMSPEQAAGDGLGPPSDWYSVGVMLYQALTGEPPYRGDVRYMLDARQHRDPPAPRALEPGVPPDLDALCLDLLHRDPKQRPDVGGVLTRLGLAAPDQPQLGAGLEGPFVGRRDELARLAEALDAARGGAAVTVHVSGPSGIGKSTLVQAFVESEQARGDLLALRGRCYEREALPFKAIDGIVDALADHLDGQPTAAVEARLPDDIVALARLFPTLQQVRAIANRCAVGGPTLDPQEARRRALDAFKALLRGLSEGLTLLLVIDDLQWGDVDSAQLLSALTSGPHAPALLLLTTHRSEEVETSPCLKALRTLEGGFGLDADVREVVVGPLEPEESARLVLGLAGAEAPGDDLVQFITREGAGSPLFTSELLRYMQQRGVRRRPESDEPPPIAEAPGLDAMIAARIGLLPPESARLLQLVAVAGRPIDRAVLSAAAATDSLEMDGLLRLRAERLVRVRLVAGAEEIESYHDRIRETVLAGLDGALQRALHRAVADALEASAVSDPEALAVHLHASGQPERAYAYTRRAAERAADALAFDQAARLFRMTLELRPHAPDEARPLRIGLADALRDAGRGTEAADAYLAAAEGAPEDEARGLIQHASTQLIFAGHHDRGLDLLRRVAASAGLPIPGGPLRALGTIVFGILRLKLRGGRWTERAADELPRQVIERLDLCWSCAMGLSMVNPLLYGAFQTRYGLLALQAGEPQRVAQALMIDAISSAVAGHRNLARTARLSAEAAVIAERVGGPHAMALIDGARGDIAWMEGRWSEAVYLHGRAVELFRAHCPGTTWEIDAGLLGMLQGLSNSGRWRAMSEAIGPLLQEARNRGDLFFETQLQVRMLHIACLVADDPERALQEMDHSAERWPRAGSQTLLAFEMLARLETELYLGRPTAARSRLEARWGAFSRNFLSRVQVMRIQLVHGRARAALACAAVADETRRARRLLGLAARMGRRIRREGTAWGVPFADAIDAGIATCRGETARAITLLEGAEQAFEAADLNHYRMAGRWRRGQLIGGEIGAELRAEAEIWLGAERVRRPERMVDMLVPGRFPESPETADPIPRGAGRDTL